MSDLNGITGIYDIDKLKADIVKSMGIPSGYIVLNRRAQNIIENCLKLRKLHKIGIKGKGDK